MTLKNELRSLIEGWGLDIEGGLRDDTSLIRSGLVDSVALFELALWLEERVGTVLNPGEFDLVDEWDSVDDIVRFVEKRTVR
jgi:acyl carrier protein